MRLIQIFTLFLFLCHISLSLRIATYNIWNQMFNWKIRRLKLSEDIKYSKIDVLGLQEVRGGLTATSPSQISELKSLLPGKYKWSVYAPANNVTLAENSITTHYPCEGVGLISSLPVVQTFVKPLAPDKSDPDKNKRVILHAVVKDVSGKLLNILVLHLSYHRQQQCKNIADVVNFISAKKLSNVVILGDLNTYKDFDDPIRLLTEGKTPSTKCKNVLRNRLVPDLEPFIDVWTTLHPDIQGLTFSNMPHPGMESRPDRVLISRSMKTTSATLMGYGDDYKQRYTNSIFIERFLTIAKSSYLSYTGVKGYPCVHDCGPQGSCRCGVCVKGGDNNCLLPGCLVCNTQMYQNLVFYSIASVIVCFHFLYAIFAILIIGSNSYGSAVYSILGFSCCLLSKELFVNQFQSYKRKYKILNICRLWPIFRLSPYLQLLISIVCFLTLYFRLKVVFEPALSMTYNTMEEEFFPSDHLLLSVDIDTR